METLGGFVITRFVHSQVNLTFSVSEGYFPISLVKSSDISPSRKYVFGYHPHGIIGMGAIANFGTEGKRLKEAGLPNRRPCKHTDAGDRSHRLFRAFPWAPTSSAHGELSNTAEVFPTNYHFLVAYNEFPYSILPRYPVSGKRLTP